MPRLSPRPPRHHSYLESPPMIRSYAYVWLATHSGLDLDTPFLLLAPDDDADLAELYLPTSLHRVGQEVMPY